MKPCPFFLEGKCKFSEEDCKFSHGVVVSVSELQSYEEHDFRYSGYIAVKRCSCDNHLCFSLAHVGGRCLARHTDGLWHPAIIR